MYRTKVKVIKLSRTSKNGSRENERNNINKQIIIQVIDKVENLQNQHISYTILKKISVNSTSLFRDYKRNDI